MAGRPCRSCGPPGGVVGCLLLDRSRSDLPVPPELPRLDHASCRMTADASGAVAEQLRGLLHGEPVVLDRWFCRAGRVLGHAVLLVVVPLRVAVASSCAARILAAVRPAGCRVGRRQTSWTAARWLHRWACRA